MMGRSSRPERRRGGAPRRSCHAVAASVLWALSTFYGAAVHAAGPLVRVDFETGAPYLVGAQIRVVVQVLVPNYFLSQPRLPPLDLPGAVVTVDEGATRNFSTTVNGASYAGITQAYLIVPQQPGEFALPAVPIAFRYAAIPGQSAEGSVTLPARRFTVALPAGMRADEAAQPMARVTIVQTLDRDVASLKVGDTLTRTVDAFAEHTRAMMIPPPAFDAPSGVRVYRQAPVLTDETRDRVGFVGGRRIDRATYLFDTAGDYTLPAIEIAWFDPASGRRRVARADAIHVSVTPNAAFEPAIAPAAPVPSVAPERNRWPVMVLLAAVAVAATIGAGWLLWRGVARLRRWNAERRARHAASEAAAFARVARACRANDAAAACRALHAWLTRAGVRSPVAPDGGDEAQRQIETLERVLFGPDTDEAWRGGALLESLREWRTAQRRRATRRAPALPALNP